MGHITLTAKALVDDTLEQGGGTYTFEPYAYETTGPAILFSPVVTEANVYMVGGVGKTEVVSVAEFTVECVCGYVCDQLGEFLNGAVFGTWVNDGKVYLDVVDMVLGLEKALEVAQERGEQAVFESVTGNVTFVEKSRNISRG